MSSKACAAGLPSSMSNALIRHASAVNYGMDSGPIRIVYTLYDLNTVSIIDINTGLLN